MSGTKPATEYHGAMEMSRSRGLGLSGSWPALVVDQTTKDHLRWNAQGRIDTHNLPITVVHLSSLNEENVPAVAIVSWRWDTEPDEISRNLLSAVILAKHEYIAYLFIDTISIDQRLPKDKLIKRVAAFSKLYSKLPVIVAYDRDDNDSFQRVMYRPWLLTELRAIRDNPYPVTYAGHMATKGTQAYGFTYCFEHIWRHSFMATIVAILMGEMQMTDISDFRFILSPISDAIQAAYAQMNQQDYLLTVALLYLPFLPGEIYFRENIQLLGYEQYEFRLCGVDCLGTWTNNPRIGGRLFHFDIFLGGMQIGDWRVIGPLTTGRSYPKYEFEGQPKEIRLFDGAVPFMLKRLGLREADWKAYMRNLDAEKTGGVMREKARQGKIQICGTVQVNLESESVRGSKIKKAVNIF